MARVATRVRGAERMIMEKLERALKAKARRIVTEGGYWRPSIKHVEGREWVAVSSIFEAETVVVAQMLDISTHEVERAGGL